MTYGVGDHLTQAFHGYWRVKLKSGEHVESSLKPGLPLWENPCVGDRWIMKTITGRRWQVTSLEGAGGMIRGCERMHELRFQEHLRSYTCISLGKDGKRNVSNILKLVELTAFMENAASEGL